MKVVVSARAAGEVRRIDAWWRSERPEAPEAFAGELIEALELLETSPEMGLPYGFFQKHRLRRVFLERTRYHVCYVAREEVVDVLSVWSALRGRPPRSASTDGELPSTSRPSSTAGTAL